jgi:CheY-like chemotaxis protein
MTALSVLHIDDEPDIREIVALSLGLYPELAVLSCASGEDGLAAATADRPDLILLDVMMPVMDGPTTLAHLRENPRTAAIPVVFMTARALSREIEQFKSLGAAGVIAKPFDPMTLAASVRSHVRPAKDMLAASRAGFLKRASGDADALVLCWLALAQEALPSVLVRIRDVAHGLAGAGGIFGFPQISDAAASLEAAAIIELNGAKMPRRLESALESLLTSIGANVPLKFEQTRQRLDA